MTSGSAYPTAQVDIEEIWEIDRPRVLRISNVGMIVILPFQGERERTRETKRETER
jgi:hypothetical protein